MVRAFLAMSLVWTVCSSGLSAQGRNSFDAARARMVEQYVRSGGVTDARVLEAMRAVPRHEFVDPRYRSQAYYDMGLPIGHNQTISSPFIVAYMTQCLEPQPGDRVLEIGTGSGYQAAVLSGLVQAVYTIEIVEPLGRRAERTLKRLGYNNVHVRIGDGFQGWPEHAPFDKIIVTCSPEQPPAPLVEQLKEGGIMVIPVGERYQQTLCVLRKTGGKLRLESRRPTLFVPMTGTAEQQRKVLPDTTRPRILNGGFEEPAGEGGSIPGWYYERLLTWEVGADAPEGEHFVTFRNDQPGRPAHLLQGFAIDGRQIAELEVAGRVRCRNVQVTSSEEIPSIAVSLYDQERRDLGISWVGPFKGSFNWTQVRKRFRIPPEAREGILRIGLFGATGEISFDDVRVVPVFHKGDRQRAIPAPSGKRP